MKVYEIMKFNQAQGWHQDLVAWHSTHANNLCILRFLLQMKKPYIHGYLLFMKFKTTYLFQMFHAKHCKFANTVHTYTVGRKQGTYLQDPTWISIDNYVQYSSWSSQNIPSFWMIDICFINPSLKLLHDAPIIKLHHCLSTS